MKAQTKFKTTNGAGQLASIEGHAVPTSFPSTPCGPLSFSKGEIMKTARKKYSTYKAVERKYTVLACLEDGFADIEALAEEIEEWASSMEDNEGLAETEKCQTLRETADTLGNYTAPDHEDIPSFLLDTEITVTEMVNRNKRRGCSRAYRMSNAVSLIRSAQEYLQEYCDNIKRGGNFPILNAVDCEEEAQDLIVSAVAEIGSELDEIEHVEFPGMFG